MSTYSELCQEYMDRLEAMGLCHTVDMDGKMPYGDEYRWRVEVKITKLHRSPPKDINEEVERRLQQAKIDASAYIVSHNLKKMLEKNPYI